MKNNIDVQMYLEFRKELDRIWVPEILKRLNTIPIYCGKRLAGILCYEKRRGFVYIDCIYVKPEYRRKGLAKKAVLEFCGSFKDKQIRLHIINENKAAFAFWSGIFRLTPTETNFVDTLYVAEK